MDHDAAAEGDAHVAADRGLVGPEHLTSLLPYLTEAVYLFDREGFLKARLSPPGGLLGFRLESGANLFDHVHPDDIPRGLLIGADARESSDGWSGEALIRLRHIDGTWHRCVLRAHNRFGDPALQGLVVVLRVVSPTIDHVEPELEAELSAVAQDLPTAYLALGPGGRISVASEAAAALLASHRSDLKGLPVADLVVDADQPVVRAVYAALLRAPGARTVVATTRTRFGSRVIEAEFHARGANPGTKLVTVVLADHTSEPELVRLATRDPLTGLANRTKVLDTITGLLLDEATVLSVVYVDLDDLKGINDAHGHEAGDAALIAVADRLRQLVRPDDVVGRMSGDEFVIVCPGLDGRSLLPFVQRIGESTTAPIELHAPDGTLIAVTVSAGGATAALGDTTASLLRSADEAMFQAKHRRC